MAVATALNLILSAAPTEFTAAMMAIAMAVAISPYSMAGAPESSRRKREIYSLMQSLPLLIGLARYDALRKQGKRGALRRAKKHSRKAALNLAKSNFECGACSAPLGECRGSVSFARRRRFERRFNR